MYRQPWQSEPGSWLGVALALALSGCGGQNLGLNIFAPERPLRPGDIDRGAALARSLCTSCHGVDGDGQGEAAAGLDPQPRDFRRGVFRYRSTPTGSLPVDEDLAHTIRMGHPGTSMPAWRDFVSAQQVRDLVAWVKSFSARFLQEEIDDPIEIPAPPPFDDASVARGKEIYAEMQCGKCHGDDGTGDGWGSDEEMKDALGRVVRARDFTAGVYRSGNRREDLYRVFFTGLDGSPMPGYEDSLPPEDIYHVVHYLLQLEQEAGFWYWLTNPPRWYEPGQQRVAR